MVFGRMIGWICAALAILLLGGDVLGAISSGSFAPRPLGLVLYQLLGPNLNLAQAIVQRYLHPAIWDSGIQPVLLVPAFIVLGLVAAVLLVLFRKRPPRRRGMFGR